MKLDIYNIEGSASLFDEQVEAFHRYRQEYEDLHGETYWKEITSGVFRQMGLSKGKDRIISFVSNDYLGLSQHPETIAAVIDAVKKYGVGTCSAPSIGGYLHLQKELEEGISNLLKTEDALMFNSGFAANQGSLSALVGRADIAYIDTGVHRSVLEGIKNGAKKSIPHNDFEALEVAIIRDKDKYRKQFFIMDGIYSQDGDIGKVAQYRSICQKHGVLLIVDDAHGIGVLGDHGGGVLEMMGLEGKIPLLCGTLSKAFGGIGGYISGEKRYIDYVRFYAGSCCFSAALPATCLASSLKALEIIRKSNDLRKELQDKSAYAKKELIKYGFRVTDSESSIIGILTPSYELAIKWAGELLTKGTYITPIGYPAVGKRKPRLRLAITIQHDYSDIDEFIKKLIEVSDQDI